MKLLLPLIVSLSLTVAAFGQADSGFTNKADAKNKMVNGAKDGKWVEYFKVSDKLEVETSSTDAPIFRLTVYNAGKPVGMVHEYYKDGKLKRETPYSNGDVNGVEMEFAENGQLVVIDTLVNDQGNGVIRTYYGNGKIKKEYHFTKDRMLVEAKLCAPGLINCVYAAINGTIETYYSTGVLKSETSCIDGKNGMTRVFDKNGNEIK